MAAHRRPLAGLLVLLLTASLTAFGVGLAGAASAADGDVTFEVRIDERDISTADANDPMRLRPLDGVVLAVDVTTNGTRPIEVRNVKFHSRVLGLAFFTYSTRVDLTVAAGATGSRTFALDLYDLGGQATGLLPAEVSLLDAERNTIADRPLTVDVRGKLLSVYGVFGLAIAAITGLLFLALILRLVSGRLPDNRLSRAWRFMLPGLGLGLTATLTASVLRVFVPSAKTSILMLIIGAAVGFVAGYLSPQPGDSGDEDVLDDRDLAIDHTADTRRSEDVGLGLIDLDQPVERPAPLLPPDNARTTVIGGQLPPPPAP